MAQGIGDQLGVCLSPLSCVIIISVVIVVFIIVTPVVIASDPVELPVFQALFSMPHVH